MFQTYYLDDWMFIIPTYYSKYLEEILEMVGGRFIDDFCIKTPFLFV